MNRRVFLSSMTGSFIVLSLPGVETQLLAADDKIDSLKLKNWLLSGKSDDLKKKIHEDFETGRVVEAHGWILSQTEYDVLSKHHD